MSYELAEKAASAALQSIANRTPVASAFARIRQLVLPALPAQVSEIAEGLDVATDVEALCEQLVHVLTDDEPAPDINGLCFGLVEMLFGSEDGSPPASDQHPEHTLYICGSTRFDPEDSDWPCDPEWWPETRYFIIPSFKALSDLCATLDDDASWLVACGLIEPLSILLVAEACRRVDRGTLLGGAPWRGIGSGFDGGDLRDIGVVTRDGFASPALVESTPAPAPTELAKPQATFKRATASKPPKASTTRTGSRSAVKAPKKKAHKKAQKKARKKVQKKAHNKADRRAGTKPAPKPSPKPPKKIAKKAPTRKKPARTKAAGSKKTSRKTSSQRALRRR